jgi:hypothetical protein
MAQWQYSRSITGRTLIWASKHEPVCFEIALAKRLCVTLGPTVVLKLIRELTSMRFAMRHTAILVLFTTGFLMIPLRGWCDGPSTVHIPAPGESGWKITKSGEGSQAAPSGFEGRTDTLTETADGNTPATAGKHVVAHFTFGNQIKTCPLADGTSEGQGVFSVSAEFTDAQANGTSRILIEMRANAKYKGQVGDDANLINPVNAEIDYTYHQTGSMRNPGGAITNSPPNDAKQHVTISFGVAKGMNPPSFGAFAGDDPAQGHYGEALGTGAALVYWAGIYYSVAEIKWLQGECAQVVFSPPSNTVALGAETTVKAEVKTKAGERAKAQFGNAHAFSGTVVPLAGSSDVGAPLRFTYTAPDKKSPNAGFGVKATSRAGVAQGEWKAGLGTGWSGQISCTQQANDGGQSELQSFSSSQATRITIDVKNGTGTANGYAEITDIGQNKQKAQRGGTIDSNGYNTQGSVEATSPAKVEVFLDKANGTYSISADFSFTAEGKQHTVSCGRDNNKCRDSDMPMYVASCFGNELHGKLSDPNQLHGSANDEKSNVGRYGKGTLKWTVTWDLGRQGSSQ